MSLDLIPACQCVLQWIKTWLHPRMILHKREVSAPVLSTPLISEHGEKDSSVAQSPWKLYFILG